MGLDISVYTNIRKATLDEIKEGEYSFIAFVINDSWKNRIKNLEYDTEYVGESQDAGISYGYGSHSRFRDKLTKVTEMDLEWRNKTSDKPSPFYELINFADNEGCLDWECSQKLYNDFVQQKDKAFEMFSEDENFIYNYEVWLKTFEIAKEKGVVVFR
jgi:hypothetical protein